jgi:hypothetical protein
MAADLPKTIDPIAIAEINPKQSQPSCLLGLRIERDGHPFVRSLRRRRKPRRQDGMSAEFAGFASTA